jgi:hypothetical protein
MVALVASSIRASCTVSRIRVRRLYPRFALQASRRRMNTELVRAKAELGDVQFADDLTERALEVDCGSELFRSLEYIKTDAVAHL